ncbi:hypothetical protein V6N11_058645 [Hibiscus sabdariffa]|uniref:Uncharacterized protein n=1 Tax=Hibiscus sabdariffa TaxID=183260 RepID=A0ABR2U5K3_9ROSI
MNEKNRGSNTYLYRRERQLQEHGGEAVQSGLIWTRRRHYRTPELGGARREGGATSAVDPPQSAIVFVGWRSLTVTVQARRQTEVKGNGTGAGGGGGGGGGSRKKERKNWF